ncbi:MAG TPA: M14 family metallopeptidase [Myxococcaceae bacterium]|nr:M14 family metallopeptidase [Myxococcaceae bacterium]
MTGRLLRRCDLTASVLFVLSATIAWGTALEPAATVSYAGQQVVRVTARTAKEVELIENMNLDVWNCFGPGIGTFDVRVTPKQLGQLADSGVLFEVVIDDVQQLVDFERVSIARAAQTGNGDWFQNFKSYQDINDRLDFLTQSYPDLAEVTVIGQSLEGRDIRVIRVTGPDAIGNPRDGRPAFVIEGTQHAREWIAPMTVVFAADRLVQQYGLDARVQFVMEGVDFYFVPDMNPDGYDYTWTSERFWRKNRRINEGSSCQGIDLNRNWEVGWGGTGSSNDPCSDVFHGPQAWSEPEVAAVRDLTRSLSARLVAYLDFHSFGQLVLSPWQYTTTTPPDADFLDGYGQLISDAIRSVHGVHYQSGQGSRILYIAAGTAHDWAYGERGAAAWGIELRGAGFVLPPEQIIPTGEENLEAILQICESLLLGSP